MLSVLPPYDLTQSPDEGAIWGDIEAFMRSVESGWGSFQYRWLCEGHRRITDKELREKMGRSVTLPGCV